jgi:hypothetical protein
MDDKALQFELTHSAVTQLRNDSLATDEVLQ